MKFKKLGLALALALGASTTQADTLLGVYLGADYWNADPSGELGSSAQDQQAFNFKSESQGSFYINLEHPIPFVPNLMLRHTQLETSGSADVSFDFFGTTYDGQADVANDLSHTDYVLYYELLDNGLVSFDLGVNLRNVDGSVYINEATAGETKKNFSGYVPMLYASGQVGILLTGLSFYGDINALSAGGHSFLDYQAGLDYQFIDSMAVDVSARIGYRAIDLEIDGIDGVYSNVDIKGVTAGLRVHF